LAYEGKLESAPADRPGAFTKSEFSLPSTRSGLYRPYPLAAREVLEAAFRRTAELYPSASHEHVLITKSHGAPSFAFTTFYQYPTTETDRATFVAKVLASFTAQLAAKLKDATPLHVSAGEKLVDEQGRAVVQKDGVLYWEQVGKLQLLSDAETLYLADRGGQPFLTTSGKRLVVAGKSLRLEGGAADLLDAQGQAVELLAVLGRNLSDHPLCFPLLRSSDFADAELNDKRLRLSDRAGGFIALLIYQPSQQEPPEGTASEAAVQLRAQFRRTAEQLQVALLDVDELVAPLIAVGKKASPLLAVNKWIGDSRLGASGLSPDENNTLSPVENNTLGREENNTLDPLANNTLDPDNNDTLSIDGHRLPPDVGGNASFRKAVRYGTSKSQYAAILARQGQTAGMFFRVVFLESCQSQLSGELLKQLRAGKSLQSADDVGNSHWRGALSNNRYFFRVEGGVDGISEPFPDGASRC